MILLHLKMIFWWSSMIVFNLIHIIFILIILILITAYSHGCLGGILRLSPLSLRSRRRLFLGTLVPFLIGFIILDEHGRRREFLDWRWGTWKSGHFNVLLNYKWLWRRWHSHLTLSGLDRYSHRYRRPSYLLLSLHTVRLLFTIAYQYKWLFLCSCCRVP